MAGPVREEERLLAWSVAGNGPGPFAVNFKIFLGYFQYFHLLYGFLWTIRHLHFPKIFFQLPARRQLALFLFFGFDFDSSFALIITATAAPVEVDNNASIDSIQQRRVINLGKKQQ